MFDITWSSAQATPLAIGHSLSAPPSDESVEPSGPYPELVGCLMYLMNCTRPDLAYPLGLLARYVAPGRHRKVHMDAAKRVLRYLCSTSGMGLVLGGWGDVVLTGHSDASWAEIYATVMAERELRWLTYLLTDLGERPRSPPVLYVDNKAHRLEHRLEHRTKYIALCYFLARELQQRGQLRLTYVATRANTADIFTKALPPGVRPQLPTSAASATVADPSGGRGLCKGDHGRGGGGSAGTSEGADIGSAGFGAVPSSSPSGPHIPSFSMNLVGVCPLQDLGVTTTFLGHKRFVTCTDAATWSPLATFHRDPALCTLTLHTTSTQVSASGHVAMSYSCRLLTQPSLLWHHHLGHHALPHLHHMAQHNLVLGLPRRTTTGLADPPLDWVPFVVLAVAATAFIATVADSYGLRGAVTRRVGSRGASAVGAGSGGAAGCTGTGGVVGTERPMPQQ
ncbi:unnamed protein product [Closterium sp. NIES-54]